MSELSVLITTKNVPEASVEPSSSTASAASAVADDGKNKDNSDSNMNAINMNVNNDKNGTVNSSNSSNSSSNNNSNTTAASPIAAPTYSNRAVKARVGSINDFVAILTAPGDRTVMQKRWECVCIDTSCFR